MDITWMSQQCTLKWNKKFFIHCHRPNHLDFLHPTKESSPTSLVSTSTAFAVVTLELSQSLQWGEGQCRRLEFCVHWFLSAFPSSFLLYFFHCSRTVSVLALPEVACSVPEWLYLGLSPSRLHFRAGCATGSLAAQALPGVPDNLSQK